MAESNPLGPFREPADVIAEAADADVLFLNGPLVGPLDFTVVDLCESRRRRKNVLCMMVTEGGDADVAYRIARCLQSKYDRFVFFVTGYCKSAGTLVALGAHEIVIADRGELGPLDIQLGKEDELFETRSGLTVLSALSTLHKQAFDAYEYFMLQTKLRGGGSITTKTAIQVATSLAGSLFGRVYDHVDAMHVGEAGLSLRIANQYGQVLQRASQNYTQRTLDQLTTEYPSHGFIIDRLQAEGLFRNVRAPASTEAALAKLLGDESLRPRSRPSDTLLTFLNTQLEETLPLPGLELQEKDATTSEPSNPSGQPEDEAGNAPDDTGADTEGVDQDSSRRLRQVGTGQSS